MATKTVGNVISGIVTLGLVVTLGVVAVRATNIDHSSEEMPPDPFVSDEPRVVELVVDQLPPVRDLLITWEVGVEDGETRSSRQQWSYVTTAVPGSMVRLTASQPKEGPVECFIFIDNTLADSDDAFGRSGCFAEAQA